MPTTVLNTGKGLFCNDPFSSRDRYELIASVGRGKLSEVFKAYDKKTGEYVSIKQLKPLNRQKMKRYGFKYRRNN